MKVICGCCGGEDVLRDAWARWDAMSETWEVRAILDAGWCHDCDGEVVLETRPERANA
jgi:hypothetical protein